MPSNEFAPGLPAKDRQHPLPTIKEPTRWEFGLHRHDAERAGLHFDLRLGDPSTGHAHSWAIRKQWPAPGEVRLAVRQPTHTLPYMDFEGRIEQGYGKGDVALARREKTEVVSSSPKHVRFNLYSGKNVEEYLLRQADGDQWMLYNITPTRTEDLPSSKPKYKEKKPHELSPEKPDTVWQAKIDGAHVLYQFKEPGSQTRVFSYRPTERTTGIIEHTHRLPGFNTLKTPVGLENTILRGELTAAKDGQSLPAHRVGGILNAGVWKSREKQKQEGELVPYVFDVVRWKGKNVEDAPYREKLKLLEEAVSRAPWLRLPRTATTPSEKKKLYEDIQEHKEPSTVEGLIEWHLDKPVPTKAKFKDERDVYIREIFAEKATKREGLAGGFEYSMSPTGPIVGRVGTGMSHALKKDMLARPEVYKGLKAKVRMTRGHLGRAPSFAGFHLDQDLPEGIKLAETYLEGFLPEEREEILRGRVEPAHLSIVDPATTSRMAHLRLMRRNPIAALVASPLFQSKYAAVTVQAFGDELEALRSSL